MAEPQTVAAAATPPQAEYSPYDEQGIPKPVGADPAIADVGQKEPTSLLGAMWRQTTAPGSVFSSNWLHERIIPHDNTPISTDELIKSLDADQMWGHEDLFLEVHTRGMYEAIKNDVRREEDDRQVIADAGAMKALGAGLLVAPLDPINWLPVGTAVKGIATGSRILNTTLKTAGAAGIAAAAQEPFQQIQQLRTGEEAAFDIGATALLGGVLGSSAAMLTSPLAIAAATRATNTMAEWLKGTDWNERVLDATIKAWTDINDEITKNPLGRRTAGGGRSPSVGQLRQRDVAFDALQSAAERIEAVKQLSLAQTGPFEYARSLVPRLTGRFLGSAFYDPIDYIMKRSASVEGRKSLEQLIEIPMLLNKNLSGSPTAQAATTEMDRFVGAWAAFRDKLYGGSMTAAGKRMMGQGDSIYTQARKAGFTGSFEDFDRAIFRAVIDGHVDPNGNPAITKAAQEVKKLTEQHRELMKAAGYDVPETPRGALGYAPRQYIIPNVVGADGKGTAAKLDFFRGFYNEKMTEAVNEATAAGTTVTPQKERAIRKEAKRLANESYANITREGVEGGIRFQDVTAGSPLKERVIPLSDAFLMDKGYIDGRITDVLNLHIRRTVPELLLAQRFKTPTGLPDPGMESSVIPALTKEYQGFLDQAATPAERQAILDERNDVINMFRALRDQILLGPRLGEGSIWRKVESAIHMVKLYQVIRLMGMLLPASIPDLANIQVRNGLGPIFKVFANDIRGANLKQAIKLEGMTPREVSEEATRWGAATEWSTNATMGAQLDLISPFQATNPMQRGLYNISRAFSIANLSITWNDSVKKRVYRVGMDRVLHAAEKGFDNITDYDKVHLAQLGVGKAEVNRIGAAWRSQTSPLHDGWLRFGHMSQWDDQEAARLLSSALAKDNASTVIRPRIGDTATIVNNPFVSLILQFQKFTFSHALRTISLAEQRVIRERGIGADSLRVYGGLASMLMLGGASQYLYAVARDAAKGFIWGEDMPTVKKLEENPGQWLANAIDRSSILGMYGYWNNYWERLGNPGLTRVLQNTMGDPSLQNESKGRWMDRDPLQVMMGPTASQVADVIKLGGHAWGAATQGKDFKRADARTIREAGPFQNHFIMRHVYDAAQKHLAEDVMGLPYR